MLQRIQSVYLAIALVCSALLFFIPFLSVSDLTTTYKLSLNGLQLIQPEGNLVVKQFVALPIISAAICVLTLIIIFRFKNRMQQIKLAQFNLLLNTGCIAALFYYADEAMSFLKTTMQLNETIKPSYSIAIVLPIISIILTFMAINKIKKDEELVRSADRIR